jgi:hypothetical protein
MAYGVRRMVHGQCTCAAVTFTEPKDGMFQRNE